MTDETQSHNAPKSTDTLNKLRAAVLGANDGVVSISAVLVGVAGATNETGPIFTAGLAALVAGALSMAVGEYVSVSSQSDAEKTYIEKEKKLLATAPEKQLEDLTASFVNKGINPKTAAQVARELTESDPLKAHLMMEFGMSEDDVVNPWSAAVASFISFTFGGLIPFIAILAAPAKTRLIATGVAVLIALSLTGYMSAKVGDAPRGRAIFRVVFGGLAAMVITYYVGVLFGTSIQ